MNRRFASLVALGLAAALAVSGFILRDLSDISSGQLLLAAAGTAAPAAADRPTVRIGVVSRFAPNVIYAGYQPIMDYLNREGTHHYELKLSTSYLDAVQHLRTGEVTASFLGAWIFGHLEADADLVPIAAPLNADGRSAFQAVLVTRSDGPLRSLADLRGRRVALPSPQSWSGNWLQTAALPGVGLAVADLDTLHHFDHHQTVARQVLRGDFDAGVVKESVAAKFRSEGLREVARSAPIPGPPLVACRSGPPAAVAEISRLLLALDAARPADRAVLATWTREFAFGFTPVSRGQYLEAFRSGDGAE